MPQLKLSEEQKLLNLIFEMVDILEDIQNNTIIEEYEDINEGVNDVLKKAYRLEKRLV